MSDLREAARQALEALNSIDVGYRSPSGDPLEVSFDEVKCEAAIAALRAALAQEQAEPVQEPVAWLQPKTVDGYSRPDLGYETCSNADYGAFAVYTAPPQRQLLTEEEIDRICASLGFAAISPAEIVRAIERAHGIGETK